MNPARIVLIEDNPADVLLIELALKENGISHDLMRFETVKKPCEFSADPTPSTIRFRTPFSWI